MPAQLQESPVKEDVGNVNCQLLTQMGFAIPDGVDRGSIVFEGSLVKGRYGNGAEFRQHLTDENVEELAKLLSNVS